MQGMTRVTDLAAALGTHNNTSEAFCLLPPIRTTSNCLLYCLFLPMKLVFHISWIIFHWLVPILALQELEENGMKAEDSMTSTVYMLLLSGWRQKWFTSTCKQHHTSELTLCLNTWLHTQKPSCQVIYWLGNKPQQFKLCSSHFASALKQQALKTYSTFASIVKK